MYGNRVEGVEKPQFPAFMSCRAFAFLELRMPRVYRADGSPAPCGMAYPIRKLGGRAWIHSAARQMPCRTWRARLSSGSRSEQSAARVCGGCIKGSQFQGSWQALMAV